MISPAQSEYGVEDPQRQLSLSKPEVVEILRLEPGMTVAEVGAGCGSLSQAIAQAVAPNGRVLAIENDPAMLARFREKGRNLESIQLIEKPYEKDVAPQRLLRPPADRQPLERPLRPDGDAARSGATAPPRWPYDPHRMAAR